MGDYEFWKFNKVCNFQDTIVVCKIFEQCSDQLQKLFGYNPHNLSSASCFSGWHHSKCCIALPTDAEHVRIFEKALIGGFGCVNTRLVFNTQILASNKKNEKVLFDLFCMIRNQWKKQTKRVVTKILKMEENNKYGEAMTKALPCGCIKKPKTTTLLEFKRILDN